MALSTGTITVNPDGTYSGSGLAFDLFEADVAGLIAWSGWASFPSSGKVSTLTDMRTAALARAAAVIAEIANGDVTVTVAATDAGLQRMPAVTTVDTPTKAPAAPVVLATKGTIA